MAALNRCATRNAEAADGIQSGNEGTAGRPRQKNRTGALMRALVCCPVARNWVPGKTEGRGMAALRRTE
jgi:hypothetical protein